MVVVEDDLTILLVEDSENDIALICRALREARVCNPLRIVRGGEEALAYLEKAVERSDTQRFPFPDLVLLDLKMPGLDGFDVLRWIRMQPALRGLPVIVLSASEDIADV